MCCINIIQLLTSSKARPSNSQDQLHSFKKEPQRNKICAVQRDTYYQQDAYSCISVMR